MFSFLENEKIKAFYLTKRPELSMQMLLKLLCLIPLFIGLPKTVLSEDWSELLGTELGDVVYIDKTTIKVEDNLVTGKFLINYSTPEPFNNALSNVQHVSFDCSTSQFQVLNDQFFSNQNATGKLLQDSNWPMPKMRIPRGSSWDIRYQYMCTFATSSSNLSRQYSELIERIEENNNALIMLGYSNTFGRIDACKLVATDKKDDYAFEMWKGAEDYFSDIYLHYSSLAYLMSLNMNRNVPDAIDISLLESDFTNSGAYESRYRQTLESDECFDFGDESVYRSMGEVGLWLIHSSSKMTWQRFETTFPENALYIKSAINERYPHNFVFE